MRNSGKERSYKQEAENDFNIFYCASSTDDGLWRMDIANYIHYCLRMASRGAKRKVNII